MLRMMKLVLVVGLALAPLCALAQQPVQTLPAPRNADPSASSTVTVTNTFQQIWAATPLRTGCTIQNNSAANTMWVFFVPPAGTAATKGTSVVLSAGQALNCAVFGVTLGNAVQITGTSGDAFYAAQW